MIILENKLLAGLILNNVGVLPIALLNYSGDYFSFHPVLNLTVCEMTSLPSLSVVCPLCPQIQGLNGTLIANQYTREEVFLPRFGKRTLISLDNGGVWEPVSFKLLTVPS